MLYSNPENGIERFYGCYIGPLKGAETRMERGPSRKRLGYGKEQTHGTKNVPWLPRPATIHQP